MGEGWDGGDTDSDPRVMVHDKFAEHIAVQLAEIEREHGVAILYANRAAAVGVSPRATRRQARREAAALPGQNSVGRVLSVGTCARMADIAFDVMLETGVLVEAIPLWEEEWEHPERFSNPALIENIRREGVRL